MINNYRLGVTLGTGFSAKVKLAQDQNNNVAALKIFDLSNQMIQTGLLTLIKAEFQATQRLDHPNIVKYYEYNERSILNKEDGQQIPVAYIAMEAILG